MTADVRPAVRVVRCPVCVDEFVWPDSRFVQVFDESSARYQQLDTTQLSGHKRAGALRSGYVRCPNPAGDMAPHYLPATYAEYRDPLIIGLVGDPMAGKTHLLTAMVREAYQGGLKNLGVSVAALDFRRHHSFHELFMRPFDNGDALAGTATGITDAADILLVRGAGAERPVTFFDVAGEDLRSTDPLNRSTRFLLGANAVIFVHALEDPTDAGTAGAVSAGWSFELAVERLLGVPGSGQRIPAAIAVTKADRMRYLPPVDRWLRRGPVTDVNADRIRAESRDVYAFLHRMGATGALRPFETFRRCTLHFVSASGGDASPADSSERPNGRHFARGVRPANVLAPLVSILAMSGVIGGPEAQKVGAI